MCNYNGVTRCVSLDHANVGIINFIRRAKQPVSFFFLPASWLLLRASRACRSRLDPYLMETRWNSWSSYASTGE